MPDEQTLNSLAAPVRLLVSQDSLPFMAEIAGRFGQRLGVEVATTPGGHDVYHEYPAELAAAVRPFLGEVSGARV
jgi:pimeloyl-ACP methyl ester carboxylesterase